MTVKVDDSRKAAMRQAENMLKMGYSNAEVANHARGCILGYMIILGLTTSTREAFNFITNEADNTLLTAISINNEEKNNDK